MAAADNGEPPQKKRGWSPEARAAAAFRMKLRHASGHMKKKQSSVSPQSGKHSWGYSGSKPPTAKTLEELPTYIDADGLKITYCPPAYANGVDPRLTARPKKGKT